MNSGFQKPKIGQAIALWMSGDCSFLSVTPKPPEPREHKCLATLWGQKQNPRVTEIKHKLIFQSNILHIKVSTSVRDASLRKTDQFRYYFTVLETKLFCVATVSDIFVVSEFVLS